MKQIQKVARVKLEFKPRFATGLPLLVLSGLLTEPETVGHCQACLLLPRSSHSVLTSLTVWNPAQASTLGLK